VGISEGKDRGRDQGRRALRQYEAVRRKGDRDRKGGWDGPAVRVRSWVVTGRRALRPYEAVGWGKYREGGKDRVGRWVRSSRMACVGMTEVGRVACWVRS